MSPRASQLPAITTSSSGINGWLSGVVVALLAWSPSQAATDFRVSRIETGVSLRQTVLVAHLRDPLRADLIVITVTADKERRLRLYEAGDDLRYGPDPVADVPLADDVIFVDVGKVGDVDALVLFTRDQALAYDPFRDIRTPLVTFRSMYNNAVVDEVPRMNVLRDLSGDGLDDFIIPDFVGYQIFLQSAPGVFRAPIQIAAPPIMEISFGNNPWYQSRTLFHTDMTGDGRQDLVFWIDDAFAVFPATEDGFSTTPRRLESRVQFQYDGIARGSFRMGREDQSNLTAKALYQLRDLDNDGLTDLVTLTVMSQGVFKKQSIYSIHPGRRAADGTTEFASEAGSTIQSSGVQFELEQKDLNRDGQLDVMVSSVQLGIGKIVGALITGSIDIDLNFYQMKAGLYPAQPNVTREITASFNLTSGDVFYPFVLIGDVNGDHLADLLVQDGKELMRVYEGDGSERLFSRSSHDIRLPLPEDPGLIALVDLNRDGKQDILMRLEKKNKANGVTVLMAR